MRSSVQAARAMLDLRRHGGPCIADWILPGHSCRDASMDRLERQAELRRPTWQKRIVS